MNPTYFFITRSAINTLSRTVSESRETKPKEIKKIKGKIVKIHCDVMNYDDLRKKIARNGWAKYHKYFNSQIVSNYIIDKVFNLNGKSKTLWEK